MSDVPEASSGRDSNWWPPRAPSPCSCSSPQSRCRRPSGRVRPPRERCRLDRDRHVRRSSVPRTGTHVDTGLVATMTARSIGPRLPSCPGASWRSPSPGVHGARAQLQRIGRKAGSATVAGDAPTCIAVSRARQRYGHRDPCISPALGEASASRCEAHNHLPSCSKLWLAWLVLSTVELGEGQDHGREQDLSSLASQAVA